MRLANPSSWRPFFALLLTLGVSRHVLAQASSQVYLSGLSSPIGMVQDPADGTVQYVIERAGRIRVVQNGVLQGKNLIDLTGQVSLGNENGLTGLAFPPNPADTRAFLRFTNLNGDVVVSRYRRSGDPQVLNPASRLDFQWADGQRVIPQPSGFHHGGQLVFGPDGLLYIGIGDGGPPGSLANRSQDPATLYGKMLRLDVDVPDGDPRGYAIPPTNPFAGNDPLQALDEIWSFGFRNPWRFSFDPPAKGGTGALIIGDVGEQTWEEVDYEPAGRSGRNYGWSRYEGNALYDQGAALAFGPATFPIHTYPRGDSLGAFGNSIIGGQIYRGSRLGPEFVGRYFFADFVSHRVASLQLNVDPVTREATVASMLEHTDEFGGPEFTGWITSIDVDAAGELYFTDMIGGRIWKIVNLDTDADGLPDAWEIRFGLDPNSAVGDDGADGDPDHDGRTNLEEYQAGTHPLGLWRRYFAEGANSLFFLTRFAVANPNALANPVVFTFFRSDGLTANQTVPIGPLARVTLESSNVDGFANAEFSTLVESRVPVGIDRTMTWDATGYGSHAETGIEAPQTTWYLAEGATHSGFDLFYLFQNPGDAAANVHVRYLLAAGAPIDRDYVVPARSRFNVWVDQIPQLANAEISAVITVTNGVPILVERAMYLSTPAQPFAAGHDSAAVKAPAARWFFAEGATGPFFDEFVLIANPATTAVQVRATYLLVTGMTMTKTYSVPAQRRFNIWVDEETFPGVSGKPLADAAVSIVIEALDGGSVVAERTMWWPGPTPATWFEAHNVVGATSTASRWLFGEGEDGRAYDAETYFLIANTGATTVNVGVTLLFDDQPPSAATFAVRGNSRFNVQVRSAFPQARNRRFGAIVAGPAGAQLVVERALYSNAQNVPWAAGTAALGTPEP